MTTQDLDDFRLGRENEVGFHSARRRLRLVATVTPAVDGVRADAAQSLMALLINSSVHFASKAWATHSEPPRKARCSSSGKSFRVPWTARKPSINLPATATCSACGRVVMRRLLEAMNPGDCFILR